MPAFAPLAGIALMAFMLTGCPRAARHADTDPQPAALPPAVTITDDTIAEADVAAAEGRYDDAVVLLEGAAEPSPRVIVKLAELYVRTARPAEAIARLVPLASAYSPARLALARALHVSGDARGAVRVLDGANEDTPEFHETVGRARLALGDVASARIALGRAVAIDPRRFETRLTLARLAGQEPVADVLRAWAADATERVRTSPRDAGRRAELARVHALAGRRADAAREYAEALAIAPALPAANVELALIELAAGRADDAVVLLERAVRSTRRHRQANILLAEHYEGLNRAAKAIDHLEAAYGAHPPLDVRLRLVWLHAEAGNAAEALARAQAAVAQAPRSAAAHATLGRLYLAQGDVGAAQKALEDALAIGDPNAAPYLTAAFESLGSTYGRLGQPADAVAALTRATDLARSASLRSE